MTRLAMMTVLGVVLVAAACGGGGDDGADDTGDDGGGDDSGPAAPQFDDTASTISIYEGSAYGSTYNNLDAGFPTAPRDDYTEVMRAGNCRVLTSDATLCGECNGWCVDDVCQEFPTYRNAGRLTATGLATTVTATWQSGYYAVAPWPLPADLFDAGAPISVTAAGGEVPAFTVAATGVATLEPELDGACDNEWHVTRGQDATLRWDRVGGSRVRLWLPSPNNSHGLPSNAVIECEGPDTGELVVPSAMIALMPDFYETDGCDGVSCVGVDCPPATLARYTAGTATAGTEPVRLRVESRVTFLAFDE